MLVSPHQEVGQATLRVTWTGSGERIVPQKKNGVVPAKQWERGQEKTAGIHYTPISNSWK